MTWKVFISTDVCFLASFYLVNKENDLYFVKNNLIFIEVSVKFYLEILQYYLRIYEYVDCLSYKVLSILFNRIFYLLERFLLDNCLMIFF